MSLLQSLTAGGNQTPRRADLTQYVKSSDHRQGYFRKIGHGLLDMGTQSFRLRQGP